MKNGISGVSAVMLSRADGSISTAWDIAAASHGTVYVAGSRGNQATSNAAAPWVAAIVPGEGLLWEDVPVPPSGHSQAKAVTVTPDGGALAAGYGEQAFVGRYEADGELLWNREVDRTPTALAAGDDGYLVGLGLDTSGDLGSPDALRLEFVAWDGTLLWRQTRPDCHEVKGLVLTEDSVVVLMACGDGFGLARHSLELD